MSESSPFPTVALLYGDAELNRHLREALRELGVHIAHEGLVADARGDELATKGIATVVVNLESVDENHLDHLYDVLDAGDWDVIFNDADASHALSGWDRARWARHLAAKLTGGGVDVDPPRPPGSMTDEPPSPHRRGDEAEPVAADTPPDAPATEKTAFRASYEPDDDLDLAIDGGLGVELTVLSDTAYAADASAAVGVEAAPADTLVFGTTPGLASSHAVLPSHDDVADTALPAWSLVELDVAGDSPRDSDGATPSAIGAIDSLHAGTVDLGAGISALEMELAPVDEASRDADDDVAMFHEMRIGTAGPSIRRVVVIVGDHATMPVIAQLLSALPRPLPGLVLVVQHPADHESEISAVELAGIAGVPVKVVATEALAHQGEVWLVPAKGSLRVLRDGHMALRDDGMDAASPRAPLDNCMDALTDVFAHEVTLAVMSGSRGNDGLAGAHLVATCGGQVWLEEQALAAPTGLAHAIEAEGLASGSGTPVELAGYLAGGKT